ncbi:hypothetical protein SE17_28425 [Kouleothrix aurantiaca]|uniref:Uncharacterized protein n=1 Tax=Kouleothrix aurantiaca TaxID=186479 RepID=A0A0N8PRK6_9CHLR|nr:hypothetical protein SE17_28425 [Kouleothrix aurantiaca]
MSMITIHRLSDGLLLTPSGTAAPALITDAALSAALGPAIVALALGVHAAERARVEGYARIAAAAYDGQQSSQRELEALYQAATERAERAENRQRGMVTALLHTYVRLFPTYEFVSYEQALAVIEREWNGMRVDATAMADALQAYFNARSSTEPHDTPEYIGAMAEALSAWGRREQGGML